MTAIKASHFSPFLWLDRECSQMPNRTSNCTLFFEDLVFKCTLFLLENIVTLILESLHLFG